MAQIYSSKSSNYKMNPKQKTVEFLLNFSKSFKTVRTKANVLIELNLN